MLRLSLRKEPYWLDLPHDVRLRVTPLTTPVYEAARAKGNAHVRDLILEQRSIAEAGGRVVDLPDLDDEHVRAGMAEFLFVAALAQVAILEWEGVGDAEGEPAPVTAENIRALMSRHEMAEAFLVAYSKPLLEAQAEGNASGTAPNGTAEAVPHTAEDAESKTSPAPEASAAQAAPPARTKKARRAP